MKIKTILVGMDFSDACRAAIRLAAGLARTHGSRLALAHVVDVPRVPHVEVLTAGELALGGAHRRLDRVAARLRAADLEVDTLVAAGRPCAELLRIAGQVQADLIIVGTRGLGALRRLFLGSTAERILRSAPVPVLVVRAAEGAPVRLIHADNSSHERSDRKGVA